MKTVIYIKAEVNWRCPFCSIMFGSRTYVKRHAKTCEGKLPGDEKLKLKFLKPR